MAPVPKVMTTTFWQISMPFGAGAIHPIHYRWWTPNEPQRFVRAFIEKSVDVKSVWVGLKNPSLHQQHSLFVEPSG
jgi:hypothetical protein